MGTICKMKISNPEKDKRCLDIARPSLWMSQDNPLNDLNYSRVRGQLKSWGR